MVIYVKSNTASAVIVLVSRTATENLCTVGMGEVVSTLSYGVIQSSYYVGKRVDKGKIERRGRDKLQF